MKLYPESEKSTFPYWLAHWWMFNVTAIKLGAWKLRYIFHDMEKPFLMLAWKDYPRVRAWHRKHARHHYHYDNGQIAPWLSCDYTAMVIDWECSRFTKIAAPLTAYETFCYEINEAYNDKNPVIIHILVNYMLPVLKKLGLCTNEEFAQSELGKKITDVEWTKWDGSEFYKKLYGREAPRQIVYENCSVFDEDGEIKKTTLLNVNKILDENVTK